MTWKLWQKFLTTAGEPVWLTPVDPDAYGPCKRKILAFKKLNDREILLDFEIRQEP